MFAYAGVEYEDIRITKEEWLAEWKNSKQFPFTPSWDPIDSHLHLPLKLHSHRSSLARLIWYACTRPLTCNLNNG